MDKFTYNEKYILKNDKPWFPVMGEFHYSRYDRRFWKESLYKMKAGKVDVVSSYSIWIHHEEIENEFDFSGNRDLRTFVQTCKECGIYMFLRVGPWSHAEARNGGFPDWLCKKHKDKLRTNDEAYLKDVRKYYEKLYEQVEGLFLKDGGPIIGIQVENEYGHCGGLQGDEGERHMITLTNMLKEIGFDAPLYTATGWGGAVTGGLLPVMGGYCESPWDQRITEIEPSGNYIFTYERNDHNIGNDFGLGEGITFDMNKFPYLTAELGGGLQVTHHRRPVATASDIGAVSLVKLGSGVSLLGYYMYHGGTNPDGKLSTLQESKATGYANDLPEKNYDFNAPIKEFGQMSDTLKEIKILGMFIEDFGEQLCDMPAYIPDDNPLFPDNYTDLRYAFRHNGKSGYAFVNNYQRRRKMAEHENVKLKVRLEDEEICFDEFSIKDKEYFFLPFNMKAGNALIKTALVTPLCKIGNDIIFYGNKEPKFKIEGDLGDTKLITLSRKDALNSWKVKKDREYLYITDANVVQMGDKTAIISKGDTMLKIYPKPKEAPDGFSFVKNEGEFAIYERKTDKANAKADFVEIKKECGKTTYEINIDVDKAVNDIFLIIDYSADSARMYCDNKLLSDSFYTGQTWEFGLKQFDFPKKLTMEVFELKEDAKVFLEKWPAMENAKACRINDIKVECEYIITV